MAAGTEIRVDLLGPVRLSVGGTETAIGPPRQRALLGFLAASVGRTVSRDELVDAVWGEAAPQSASRNTQTYVSGLRRLLEGDRPSRSPAAVLVTSGTGYRLELPDSAVDVRRAQMLLDDAAALVRAGRGAESVGPWRTALDLWHGTPFADVTAPYVAGERGRLAALRLTGEEGLAGALLMEGRAEEAVAVLAAAIIAHPLHEGLTELQMRALQQAGRTAEALALYTRTSKALADRLGLDLTPGLRALHAELLADRGRVPRNRLPELPERTGFRGREAELAEVTDRLAAHRAAAADGRPLIFAVDGPPGVGKTAFAVEFAHRVRDRFPDGAHFLNLRGHRPDREPMTAEEALTRLLGTTAGELPRDERAAAYRSAMAGKRALIVLDDATQVEQVRPLLPGSGGCLVVVTSRIRLAGLAARHGALRVPLSPLGDDDARHLLAGLLDAEPGVVAELAALCGNLPLALTLIAKRAQADPAGLLAQLRANREDLLRGDSDDDGLRAVFSWSLDGLGERAARLFVLLGLHPGGTVTPPVAAALLDVPTPAARRLLDELATASLLDWGQKRSYRTHDLLRLYATDLATGLPPADRAAAEDRLFRHYLHTARAAHRRAFPLRGLPGERFPAALEPTDPTAERVAFVDEAAALAWYESERDTLVAVVRRAAARGRDDIAAWLPLVLADFLRPSREAADIFRTSVAAARRADDPRATHLATLYLGNAMFPDGAARRAAVSLQEAFTLASAGTPGGPDRAETAYVLGLAAPVGSQRSLRLLASAAHIYNEQNDRDGRASALLALGSAHAKRGDVTAAINTLRTALQLLDDDRATIARDHLDRMNGA